MHIFENISKKKQRKNLKNSEFSIANNLECIGVFEKFQITFFVRVRASVNKFPQPRKRLATTSSVSAKFNHFQF